MIEITKIESQKNKNKFNLFVDGMFYSGVLKETAIANNFFVGKKIEQTKLDDILLQSESKQAFNKASDYLATRLHSVNELKIKLFKKGFSINAIDLAIKKLQEYGYVNDGDFAKQFVQSNNNLSKQMICNKLTAKGVSKQVIDKTLIEFSNEAELEVAQKLTEKYLKNKDYAQVKTKLYGYLMRKGFNYDIIKKAIHKVVKIDIDWE